MMFFRWILTLALAATFNAVHAIQGNEFTVRSAAEIRSTMANLAKPGDTLVMANGEWRDVTLIFEGHGTSDLPIVLRAETPGKVVLSGQSRLRIGGSHLTVDGLLFTDGYLASGSVVEFRSSALGHATDSRLTNTGFVRYNPPDRTTNYKWVSLFGRRNRVDHCRFDGMDHVGQAVTVWIDENPNYHRIDHNLFGPRPPLGMNGGEMIRIGDSATSLFNSRTVVERNVFYECDGEGEIISNKSSENIIRSNTFIRSAGALTLRHGNRNRVEGNFFIGGFKPGTGGVRIINEGQIVVNNYFHGLTGRGFSPPLGIMNGKPDSALHEYFQVKDAIVAFNTFVDCERPVIIGLGAERSDLTLAPENLIMANNVFTSTTGPIIEMRDTPVSIAWSANLVHGATVGIPQTDGVFLTDPRFEEDGFGLFIPGPESPALEAAADGFDWVNEDILGRPRPANSDIGAFHRSEHPPTRLPQNPGDVGPEWMRGGWEKWRSQYFNPAEWAAPEISAPWASKASDDSTNLLRFALALSPTEPVSPHLPKVEIDAGRPTFHYRRAIDITGAEIEIEFSANLREWHSASGQFGDEEIIRHEDHEKVTLEIAETEIERNFLRLRIKEK